MFHCLSNAGVVDTLNIRIYAVIGMAYVICALGLQSSTNFFLQVWWTSIDDWLNRSINEVTGIASGILTLGPQSSTDINIYTIVCLFQACLISIEKDICGDRKASDNLPLRRQSSTFICPDDFIYFMCVGHLLRMARH